MVSGFMLYMRRDFDNIIITVKAFNHGLQGKADNHPLCPSGCLTKTGFHQNDVSR